MKAPFPWFGGKRRVAAEVWSALGTPNLYVEPFAGSLAVLLERPDKGRASVNDLDGYIANFWRAVQTDPEQVAHYADWPVNEIDLFSRHMWLMRERQGMLDRLHADPEWSDPKIAGWWVWGQCTWIGGGWCAGGPWEIVDGRPVANTGTVQGVGRQLPRLGNPQGVKRKLPHVGNPRGVIRQRPHLTCDQGVNRRTNTDLVGYMTALADRLRDVTVCCGDWSRVVTDGALVHGNPAGIFLDPPYLGEVRARDLYATEDHTVAHDVRDWAIANGDNPRYRIVLAGYLDEHEHLMPETWRRHRWVAHSSQQTAASAKTAGGNAENRHKECLWFSPACLDPADGIQLDMFDGTAS